MTIDATNEDFLDPDPDLEDDPIDTTNLVDESALDEADSEDDEWHESSTLSISTPNGPTSPNQSVNQPVLTMRHSLGRQSSTTTANTLASPSALGIHPPDRKGDGESSGQIDPYTAFHAVPEELWRVVARSPLAGTWGVYVEFVKDLSPDEQAERLAVYESQRQRLIDASCIQNRIVGRYPLNRLSPRSYDRGQTTFCYSISENWSAMAKWKVKTRQLTSLNETLIECGSLKMDSMGNLIGFGDSDQIVYMFNENSWISAVKVSDHGG